MESDTNNNQQIFEFAFEFEFVLCFAIFPYINEVVECAVAAHGKVLVSFTEPGVAKSCSNPFQYATDGCPRPRNLIVAG